MSRRYRVYLTPKVSLEEYGTEIEISNWVLASIGAITKTIDSSDFNVAVFTFSDIKITCDNSRGLFNDQNDSRSYFTYSRDLAKVRIVYHGADGQTTTFRGLIADEATRNSPTDDNIEFRILGRDACLLKAQVPTGVISNGMTYENALNTILNSQEITRVLGFDAANINPAYNGTIDDGSKFNLMNKKTAVAELLGASNSVMVLDSDDNMIVKSRAHDTEKDPLLLYGPGDLHGRENITDLMDYNTGLHRVFNSIKVGTVETTDSASMATYGARKKTVSFDWMTNTAEMGLVGAALLAEFKNLKTECQVEIPTKLAKDYDLLDRVSIDYPLIKRKAGAFFPISGITVSGDADAPTPHISGSVVIDPNTAFKIIEISEDPGTFLTKLKLRQIGTGTSDGTFT